MILPMAISFYSLLTSNLIIYKRQGILYMISQQGKKCYQVLPFYLRF